MKKKHFILILLLTSIFTWCSDPFEDGAFAAYNDEPIGLYLEAIPEFSSFVEILKKADLFNALNVSLDYTVFVANNEAVSAYLKSKGLNSIDDLTDLEAVNLMRYHIIPGAKYTYPGLSGKVPTRTASGDYLTVTIQVEDNKDVRFVNDVRIINLERFSVPLINGVLHQLDELLDPIIYTVWNLIEQNPEYSLFTKALQEAGLDSYLNERDIVLNEIILRDYKTVFVVSNEVFAKSGISNIDQLKERFTGIPTNKQSGFYKFMAYHILDTQKDFGDLTDFPPNTEALDGRQGMNLPTFADREFITIVDDGNQIILNPSDTVLITENNIPASNGYLHKVNKILEISDPLQFGFVWEPTEWDEFRTIPFYQDEKIKGVTPDERFEFEEPTEHVRWKSIPAGGITVEYISSDVDWKRFLHDDALFATFTTNVGWIEFDTPVLMRGKYNVKMVKYHWGETGKFQMYIDGQKFGKLVNFGRDGNPTLDMGVYDFPESTDHVFRFRLVEKPAGNALLAIDRFIFTPVK